MARFENGYVKLFRRAPEEDIGCSIYCWGIWVWLLCAATWKETKIMWNGEQRALPPGSVVFGISELADRWEISKSTVSRWIHYLADTGRIEIESGTRGSIATIKNWKEYQLEEFVQRTVREREENARRTRGEREENLIEEEKKGRREENTCDLKFEIEELSQEWIKTALHFGSRKSSLTANEQTTLGQAILRFGYDETRAAIIGARFEQKTDTFDPAKNLTLNRTLFGKTQSGVVIREKLAHLASQSSSASREVYDPDAIEGEAC